DALRQRADAAAPPPPPTERTGFMARLALGFGWANADTEDYRIYGGSRDLLLALRWRVAPPLSGPLTLSGASAVGACRPGKGAFAHLIIRDADTKYTAGALGAGVTWLLPSLWYLSGSLGGATVSAERGGTKADSKLGFALFLGAGKEWTLGGAWRAGVAASVSFLTIPEDVMGAVTTTHVQASVVLLSLLATIAFDYG